MTVLLAVLATLVVTLAVCWLAVRGLARRVGGVVVVLDPDAPADQSTLTAVVTDLESAVAGAVARREEQLVAEQRLRTALDAIPHGVVVVDGSGEVVFANEPGAQWSASRHGDALVEAAMNELLGRAVRDEASVETIELFGPPRRTLVITAVPLGADSEPTGAIAVIEDVTERRRLETLRRDFVSNISHELKTPVGALALLAETLVGEDDTEVAGRLAERVYLEAHRVGRTIDDLLELSRIEAEENPRREPIAVRDVLEGAIERMRPAADHKQIHLDLADVSRHLVVDGDGRQLVSAVFNLLENAVKYSDTGSVVHLRATSDGSTIDISVEDHGIGIPARDRERVFERFYRVDRARSRETGGTGLGLAIVRHVVNNHHGEVLVESVEGEGTTFTLRLPIAAGPVPVTTREAG